MQSNTNATYGRRTKLITSLLAGLNTSSREPMSKARRNAIIRTVATITGDIAAGFAMASVAAWFIEAAALGLFLSFLVWLLAALAALALSQYVVHPAATVLLSDHKLDMAIDAVSGLANRLALFARSTLQPA